MKIIPERRAVFVQGMSPWQYRTEDGLLWDTIGEAIEYVEGQGRTPTAPATYEGFLTIQEAINKCVAENRVVRFLTSQSNDALRKGIDDLKGCRLVKPSRESNDVAVLPPGYGEFDFEEVK